MIRKKQLRLVDKRSHYQWKRSISEAQEVNMKGDCSEFGQKRLTGLEETLAELQYAMAHPNEYKYYTDIDELMRDLLSD